MVAEADAEKGRATAEKMGMRVHSVLRGWAEFNSPDASKVAASLATTEAALKAAAAYGADAVLTVPCRVGNTPMPQPWEFKIASTRKPATSPASSKGTTNRTAPTSTFTITRSTPRSRTSEAHPLAEKLKVIVALENVWNNLWVDPAIFRHFVASFQSPWVKAYYDIGNHVKYGPPQDWVHTLGSLIVKCHVKDYRFTADRHAGNFVHPRDGSIEWPAVRKALDDVGYNGWLTIEDGGIPLKEFNRRIDLIIAGE